MSRDGRARKPDSRERGRISSDDSGQWAMLAFNQITDRLDRIDDRFDRLDDRLDRIDDRFDRLERAVENLKKVVWTAAGAILAFGVIASALFGFTDLITGMAPVEITIQRLPVP